MTAVVPDRAGPPDDDELRVVSYNVRSLRDERGAVAAVLRACRPDVACIQEAPRFLRWRSSCARLARESGLLVVTGGRPAGAVLLLANLRVRVVETRDVLFTRTPGLHQRGMALAVVEVAGRRVAVASTHLGLVGAERSRHVGELLGHFDGMAAPVVVAGDINEEPGAPAWTRLSERFADAFAVAGAGGGETFSATRPDRRIDAVFADRRLDVVSCEAVTLPEVARASDHRPVLAVLRLP